MRNVLLQSFVLFCNQADELGPNIPIYDIKSGNSVESWVTNYSLDLAGMEYSKDETLVIRSNEKDFLKLLRKGGAIAKTAPNTTMIPVKNVKGSVATTQGVGIPTSTGTTFV
jgi:hypothetical protein